MNKLSGYQKAELWSQISLKAHAIVQNERTEQNSAEFYKAMDDLIDMRKKLRLHEVACTIEKGEEKTTVTLTACDKDSSSGHVKQVHFENKEDFLAQYNEFKEEVHFSRWYLEVEADELKTERLIESWLEE